MTTIDLVLRTAVSLELAALAALLMPRAGLAARLGALFCASMIAFVVTSAPVRLGAIVYPLTALCVAKSALFWLFAKALFRDGFRVRREHAVATIVLIMLGLWHELDFGRDVRAGVGGPFALVGSVAYEGLVLAFVLAAVHEAWRGLATDLVEKRRRFRVGLVAGVAAYLAIVVTVQLSNLAVGTHTAPPLILANLGLMLAAGFAATVSLLQVRRGTWIDVAWGSDAEAAAGIASAAEQALLVTLTQRLTGEALYRREGLTIGTLASILGTQEGRVRLDHGAGGPGADRRDRQRAYTRPRPPRRRARHESSLRALRHAG